MSAPLPVDEESGPFSDSIRGHPGQPGPCGPDKGEACMNAKVVCSWALVLAVLSVGVARAEDLSAPTRYGDTPQTAPAEAAPFTPPASISGWITYQRPDCCGPVGGHGPVYMELYTRTGPSLPVEGTFFGHTLETGWLIQGGGRSVFFDADMRADWAIDLSLSHTYNHGQHDDIAAALANLNPANAANAPAPIIPRAVTVRALNRTFVNATIGREWYLYGSAAECCGWRWRAGLDFGGRLGTARIDLDEFAMRSFFRRNDIISGTILGLYTDAEWSCGCCTFLIGFRAEWDYTFINDLLQLNDTDMQDVNLLLNLGVRF
jgi:hypothetical protein